MALLAAASGTSLAADYYVVVPVPRHARATDIKVALNAYSLPEGQVGHAYAGFDFSALLQVSGDPSFSAGGVRWAVTGGVLPAGLTLSADGKLSGTPTAAGAADFAVSATYKTKTGEQTYQALITQLNVTLAGATPASVEVGSDYSLSLRDYLSVTGDPAYAADDVTWSLTEGTLPPGLRLGAGGVIAGTSTAVFDSPFSVRATYKGEAGTQTYLIRALPRAARFDASTLSGWAAGLTLPSTNTALNADGTVWTVNARPAGKTANSIAIQTNAKRMPDIGYVEVVTTTTSSWVQMVGATDGKQNGIALDGPGCNRNSTYVASCTSVSGSWAGARIGLKFEKAAGRVTVYRNGVQVFTQTGVSDPIQRLVISDRDSPVSAVSRTFTIFNKPPTWQYAPAGAQPFGMD